jgi:large subunit ribosomal protein L25
MTIMENLAIQAVERTERGRSGVRQTRLAGKVPAVVYGQGQPATLVEVDAKDLDKIVSHGAAGHLITLNVGGTAHAVLMKEVQRDPVNRQVLHVDFHAVSLDRKVHTEVTIVVVGEHSRTGDRVVVHGAREIAVECLPAAIPEHIEVNAENLEVGESIKASQLILPAGVTLVTDPDTMIISITEPRAAVEAEATEAEAPAPANAKKTEEK